MPTQVLMPALSPTMTEGKLARWLKKEGDKVKSGDVLAEIETDKATMEMEAADDGVLGKIFIAGGTEGVAVNTPIAVILAEGESAAAISAPAAVAAKPTASVAAKPASVAANPTAAVAAPLASTPIASEGGRVFASPLARRMAEAGNIDLSHVVGSGPHGRIVKADIEKAARAGVAGKPAAPSVPGADYEDIPHSSMRKVIARRLTEAKQTVPHFYLSVDCELDGLLDIRKRINERFPENKLSVNDFVVKAVALALRKVPGANASWSETAIRRYNTVDIAVAVATPSGLITPILRNADKKGLGALSSEMKALAEKARTGKLTPEEYQGGGFTISNLGMYGIREFAAIINPPQACILAVGAGEQRPVVKNGALGIATQMTCTLSVDHRTVDGAMGAEFLSAFKSLIEEPLAMLL